ncbi:hypothetical protein [Amycolatopsis magusensis]|uniref:hypothetical protein n=1 Tax=Amycolatopsis magusensis TaxID=882444 RepID=UPI003C2FDB89
MAGTLMAFSSCLLFGLGRQTGIATLLAIFSAAFVGSFCGFSIRLDVRSRILVMACSALCAAGPIRAFSDVPVVSIPGLVAGCAVSTSVVVGFLFMVRFLLARGYQSLYVPDYSMPREVVGRWGQVWRNIAGGPLSVVLTTLATLPVAGYALTGIYLAQEQRLANFLASGVAAALAILVIVIPGRLVRIALDVVIDAEMTTASQGELTEVKISAFVAFFSMYAGVLCAYLSFLVASIQPDVWLSGVDPGFETILYLACVLVVLIVVDLVAARARQVIAWAVGLVACLIWSVVMAFLLMEGYEDFKQATLSILVSLAAGLFIMEGVVSNMGYLHGSPVDWQVILTAATCALVVGTTAAWVTGPALISEAGATELPFSLAGLVTGSLACISLPWLAARALPGAKPPRMYTLGAPVGGVVQDLIIIVVLFASVAWVPNFLMGHINNLGIWVGQIIPFLLLLSAAFKHFLVINIQYAKRERERIYALAERSGTVVPAEAECELGRLFKHLRRENIIALAALFPLGLFVLLNEHHGFNRGGLRKITKA